MFVLGTAGHVDHGKSTLVHALTGIDPDRLQEEKDRGLTIDLGFAWLTLPGGTEVSIVDVPGHERFIKNMLAGVGGIDLALLVIAADEGVMPQTREHLAILDLLGVENGVVVITKSDLVDPDWLDLVCAEVEDTVKGTILEGAPLLRCAATTGQGLDELLQVIEAKLSVTAPKRNLGRPRLSIDRVFTISGFGTVVTGTLIDGVLRTGQEVEIVPALGVGNAETLTSRVRGLQSHRSKVEEAQPGTRTAINLAGVEPADLARGQVVTTPGWLRPTIAVDVRLRALRDLSHSLRHNLQVSFHSLAAEAPARLRLLESDELAPGEETWAQVRLLRPLALSAGDRFIIRDANDTVGGGVIVATHARRHPRRREGVISALERLAGGDPAEALAAVIAEAEPMALQDADSRGGLSSEVAAEAMQRLSDEGRIRILGTGGRRFAYTADGFERLQTAALAAVEAYLKDQPLRRGLGKEELRNRLGLAASIFSPVLEAIVAGGRLFDAGTVVAPEGWAPVLSVENQRQAERFLADLRANPYSPNLEGRPADDLLGYLVDRGDVVDCGGGIVFTKAAFEEMTQRIETLGREKRAFTMADVRDLLGSSRRYVQPLLEELDRRRVTLRRGDERVLGRDEPGS